MKLKSHDRCQGVSLVSNHWISLMNEDENQGLEHQKINLFLVTFTVVRQ